MKRWHYGVIAVLLVTASSVGFADEADASSGHRFTDEQARVAVSVSKLGPAQERYRKCVALRESNNNSKAQNPRSSAQGTYQFLDSQWRHGLAHDVTGALREGGANVTGLREELRSTPIKKWDPLAQDVGFAMVLNANGKWSGAKHWNLAGHVCNRMVKW